MPAIFHSTEPQSDLSAIEERVATHMKNPCAEIPMTAADRMDNAGTITGRWTNERANLKLTSPTGRWMNGPQGWQDNPHFAQYSPTKSMKSYTVKKITFHGYFLKSTPSYNLKYTAGDIPAEDELLITQRYTYSGRNLHFGPASVRISDLLNKGDHWLECRITGRDLLSHTRQVKVYLVSEDGDRYKMCSEHADHILRRTSQTDGAVILDDYIGRKRVNYMKMHSSNWVIHMKNEPASTVVPVTKDALDDVVIAEPSGMALIEDLGKKYPAQAPQPVDMPPVGNYTFEEAVERILRGGLD